MQTPRNLSGAFVFILAVMPDTSVIRPISRSRRWLQKLAQALLPLMGWRVEGPLPTAPKFVLILHPHTSNWDLPIGLVCAHALGLLAEWPYGFMVKDSAVKWPVIGPLIQRLGGIAIDRRSRFNAVEQMVQNFNSRERLMLAITPEGTRKRTPFWKSGFYHIALGASLPVHPAYLDYKRRAAGVGPAVWLTGDVEADLQKFREFFANITPLYPHQAGDIRFKPNEGERLKSS